MPLAELLQDDELREEWAAGAYYQERLDDVAMAEEHDTDSGEFLCIAWDDLRESSKRPYRSAVARVCDSLLVAAQ